MLKKSLKKYIKENDSLYDLAKIFMKIHNLLVKGFLKNSIFHLNYFLRLFGISKRYSKLKSLKNTQNGRCFIVATGPSLTKEDLQKLKNETTFGVNALVKWFSEIGWETTYYAIQDLETYKKLKKEINAINNSEIFYSFSGQASLNENFLELECKNNTCEYPLYYLNHLYKTGDWNTLFSEDASKVVFDGYTVVYSLIQIAIYMGYKEIYLLGTDCNYKTEKQHAIDYGYKRRDIYKFQGDRMIYAYQFAKQYSDKHGIKIYNATRGGMLEVFPRVDLDEILINKS